MWNKLTLVDTNNKDIKNLTGMRPVLVHSAVAGLIATFLLKV
jgi:hypothetical protein